MAVMQLTFLQSFAVFVGFVAVCQSLEHVEECKLSCKTSYPQHTYENGIDLTICQRGCRLFAISQLVYPSLTINETLKNCHRACNEAYDNEGSCKICCDGCQAQMPAEKKRQEMLDEERSMPVLPLVPYMYLHGLYSNMLSRIQSNVQIWSFYSVGDNSGRLVIIRSPVIDNYASEEEKNGEVEPMDKMLGGEQAVVAIPRAGHGSGGEYAVKEQRPKSRFYFLNCATKKLNLSRLLWTATILLSAFFLLWLSFVSCATAPDRRVRQNLSVQSLESVDSKKFELSGFHPQEDFEVPALPVKVPIDRV